MNFDKKLISDIAVYSDAIDHKFCEEIIRQFHVGFTLKEVIDGVVSSEGVVSYKSDKFLIAKDIHLVNHERWDKYNVCLLYTSPSPRD